MHCHCEELGGGGSGPKTLRLRNFYSLRAVVSKLRKVGQDWESPGELIYFTLYKRNVDY